MFSIRSAMVLAAVVLATVDLSSPANAAFRSHSRWLAPASVETSRVVVRHKRSRVVQASTRTPAREVLHTLGILQPVPITAIFSRPYMVVGI
jgi:hypothetical protein